MTDFISDEKAILGTVTNLDEVRKMKRTELVDTQYLGVLKADMVAPQGIDRVLGNIFAKKLVSVIGGYGGVSKSTLLATLTLNCVTGRSIVGPAPKKPQNVLFCGIEDDMDFVTRMFQALIKHHDLKEQDLNKAHLLYAGANTLKKAMTTDRLNALMAGAGGVMMVNRDFFDRLDELVDQCNPDVVCIDPLSVLYGDVGMSNEAMNALMGEFRTLAQKRNVAVVLVSHMRKPQGGRSTPDQHDIKHGSELVDSSRCAMTVSPLQEKEVVKLGAVMPLEDAKDIRMLQVQKTNIGRSGDKWHYKTVGKTITCANGDTETVGVVEKFDMPDLNIELDDEMWQRLRTFLTDNWVPVSSNSQSKHKLSASMGTVLGQGNWKPLWDDLVAKEWVEIIKERNPESSSKTKVQRAILGPEAPLSI